MSPRGIRVHCATRTRSHVLRTPFHVTHASCVIRNPVHCLTSTSGHEDILSPTALPASGCGRCGMSTARILSQRVLVLNRAWLPVSVTSVQHALGLLFATHADTGEPKSRFLDVRSLSLIDGADLLLPPATHPTRSEHRVHLFPSRARSSSLDSSEPAARPRGYRARRLDFRGRPSLHGTGSCADTAGSRQASRLTT